MHLHLIDEFNQSIVEATSQIEAGMVPFANARELLATIPGVSNTEAVVIIAETGADMSGLPTTVTWPRGRGPVRDRMSRRGG